jgi:hypothetical protein
MNRIFLKNEVDSAFSLWYYNQKWNRYAYPDDKGLGSKSIKDFNFLERMYYGVIDHENNSVIPNEEFIVQSAEGRIMDFVADSLSLMRLNYHSALRGGLINPQQNFMNDFKMVKSYENPKIKYGEYISSILRFYNETHIPNFIGINNITSYDGYVNNFLNFFLNNGKGLPLTFSRWLTSTFSDITDTGLAFSYMDLPPDEHQRKVDQIIDSDCFNYFQNLCLNMGFSISHYRPNVLVADLSSPAASVIRLRYGLVNLEDIFNNRYIKAYTLDLDLINNYINIYYNLYASKNSPLRIVEWSPLYKTQKCGTTSTYVEILPVPLSKPMLPEEKQMLFYITTKNAEENMPMTEIEVKKIHRRSINLLKKLDKHSAMSYINNKFRDQLWNKDYGFHDYKTKLEGKTITGTQRQQGGSPRGGSSSY